MDSLVRCYCDDCDNVYAEEYQYVKLLKCPKCESENIIAVEANPVGLRG